MLLLGFGLLAAVGLGVALLEALIRRAELGAALVLGLMVLQAFLIDRVPALTLPGGIRVLPYPVFTLLLAAAVARLLRMRRFSVFQRSVVLLGAMLLLAVVRGVAAFGVEHSVAEFRLLFAFAGGTLYFATFPPSTSRNDRIGRIWLAASIPMMVLVCIRWLATFAASTWACRRRSSAPTRPSGPSMGPTPSSSHTPPCSRFPSGASRRAGTQADAAGGGAAAVRRGAEPSHRLARPPRRCRGGHVAQPQARASGGRHVRRAAAATAGGHLALPGLGKESGPVTSSGTGTLDWRVEVEGLLATWSKDPVSWLIGQPSGAGSRGVSQGWRWSWRRTTTTSRPCCGPAPSASWRSSCSPVAYCGCCGGPRSAAAVDCSGWTCSRHCW